MVVTAIINSCTVDNSIVIVVVIVVAVGGGWFVVAKKKTYRDSFHFRNYF